MSSYTEFWKLKEVIVWNVQNYNLHKLDVTFKLAYWENLRNSPFSSFVDYKVDKQKIIERTEDLNNFAKTLDSYGIIVKRPDVLENFQTFKTPHFKGVLSPISNPRDRAMFYGKKIIETPAMCRKRYFENQLFYNLFSEYFNNWYWWISAPNPILTDEKVDLDYWKNERNFEDFDTNKYDISFDAANTLRIGKDILFNISSYNHELWARWLQSTLWESVTVHKIYKLDDNHIDGKLSVLSPGKFLVNNSLLHRDISSYLPQKFKNWDMIYTWDYNEYPEDYYNSWSSFIQLSSLRWIDTNVLSLDEKTVCVTDTAIKTSEILSAAWFSIIPIRMRHSEIFWWGLHCATLDVDREDDFIDYTKI